MNDPVRKSSSSGDVVLEICAGVCYIAEACVLLDQRRTFVRRNVKSELLPAAEADLVLTLASQVINAKFDISGSEEARAAAKLFKNKRNTVEASRKARL